MVVQSPSQNEKQTDEMFVSSVADFFALMKPRVMSLVVFTGFAGMYLADESMPLILAFISLFAIAAGAGASGAINQWYDRDMDAVMSRTSSRPIPAGKVDAPEALGLGIVVSILSVLMLALTSNLLAGGLLAFTIFFYAVIYTVWLKRRTPQNIVIGGAAGAFPPMVGWAAVTGTITMESILLFAIIFMWTPPHFWALALVKNADYQRAGVPMMPVVAGKPETIKQILIYSILLAPLAVVPSLIGMSSIVYGAVAALLGLIFIAYAVRLSRADEGAAADKAAMSLFKFSIVYLFLIFLGLIADKAAGSLLLWQV